VKQLGDVRSDRSQVVLIKLPSVLDQAAVATYA